MQPVVLVFTSLGVQRKYSEEIDGAACFTDDRSYLTTDLKLTDQSKMLESLLEFESVRILYGDEFLHPEEHQQYHLKNYRRFFKQAAWEDNIIFDQLESNPRLEWFSNHEYAEIAE